MLKPILIYTPKFLSLPPEIQQQIVEKTLEHISPNVDFIVFDPECDKPRYEDEDTSLRLPLDYPQKVYAKLDDYGSSQNLSNKLGHTVNTQYVITFLLPDEW